MASYLLTKSAWSVIKLWYLVVVSRLSLNTRSYNRAYSWELLAFPTVNSSNTNDEHSRVTILLLLTIASLKSLFLKNTSLTNGHSFKRNLNKRTALVIMVYFAPSNAPEWYR
ncbi:hypothetical protein D3C71_1497290 [compost metagenome]